MPKREYEAMESSSSRGGGGGGTGSGGDEIGSSGFGRADLQEVLYSVRSKLFVYRETMLNFGTGNKTWNERGIGEARILRHKEHQRLRLLMRQEKTMKVIANHVLDPRIKLQPNVGSDRSWVWWAFDFAEGELKETVFALRFSDSEVAQEFKTKFTEGQKEMESLLASSFNAFSFGISSGGSGGGATPGFSFGGTTTNNNNTATSSSSANPFVFGGSGTFTTTANNNTNNNNTKNNKNSKLCQKYQTLGHRLDDLFLDQVTPSKSTELVDETKDEELRDTSAGTTATTTTTTSNDYELAKELHTQWEHEQKLLQSAIEEQAMLGTRTGRATLLVTKLIQVFQETLQEHVANHEEEHNVNTNPPESIHDIAMRHKVNLVAYDDMVFLVEKLLDCQQEFGSANTSSNANNNTKGSTATHVDLAYHYTNQQHLQSIRQDGLLSHPERQQHKIAQTKHKAFFGEGIYVANNPFVFGIHGDTGLLVATLRGNSFRVPNHNHTNNGQQQRPTVSSDANSVIGNKHWKGHAIADELVLRTSRQVLPILQFSKELVDLNTNNHHHHNNTNDENDNDDDSTTLAQQGAELLWQFHVKMQKVLDEFMNDNQPTRPISIFLSEYEKQWVMEFHKRYEAKNLVKQAAIGAFRTLAQHHPGLKHDKSNCKHLIKILFTCLANRHAPVAPHMVQDFESKGVPKDCLSAALLAGRKHLNELVSPARLQNPHGVIRAAPAIAPAVPTATGLPATTTTTTKRTTESLWFERADQDQLRKRRIVRARRPQSSVGDNTNNNGGGGGADPTPQKSAFSGFSFGVAPAASTPA